MKKELAIAYNDLLDVESPSPTMEKEHVNSFYRLLILANLPLTDFNRWKWLKKILIKAAEKVTFDLDGLVLFFVAAKENLNVKEIPTMIRENRF